MVGTTSLIYAKKMPLMWRLSESYLHVGGKEYKITKIKGNEVTLEEEKVLFWISIWGSEGNFLYSIVIPLVALAIRDHYRDQYNFKVKQKSPPPNGTISPPISVEQKSSPPNSTISPAISNDVGLRTQFEKTLEDAKMMINLLLQGSKKTLLARISTMQ